jgi:glucose/arabinose dehydrogenase
MARLRALVVLLVVGFLVGFLIVRAAGPDQGPEDTTPVAGDTTAPGDTTGTTSPGDTTATTTPGDTSTTTTETGSSLPPLQQVTLELVFDGFRQPVDLDAPPGDDRLFVVQRVGVIRILDERRQMLDPAFLDIQDRVGSRGIEQGLLGLAFHPDYAENGRFFVYFTDREGNRQLSEFQVSSTDPNRARPDSERVIFELEQPEGSTDIRHYAGNLVFGPDGYLWVSLGDGADSRDQGQDPNTMFGTISRIDVDRGDPYGIPNDNPFEDGGGAPEAWAYGLRNPWRFALDEVGGMVYIADVGQEHQEEVNVVPITEGGYNFGWSDMEGTRCYHRQDCDPADYTSPVVTYLHNEHWSEDEPHPPGLSITGGYVYRGAQIPELHGVYFYTDWVSQWIWGFRVVDGELTEHEDWTERLGGPVGQINSFGLDGHGELYVLTHEGQVYRFTAVR